jgi:hypothetical protein
MDVWPFSISIVSQRRPCPAARAMAPGIKARHAEAMAENMPGRRSDGRLAGGGRGAAVKRQRKAPKGLALKQAFLLGPFARQLAGAAYRFGLFAGPALRGFFEILPHFHFAENAFALQFLFQGPKRLIDVIVANTDLYQWSSPSKSVEFRTNYPKFR